MPKGKLTVMKQPGKTAAILKLTDKSKTVLIKGGGNFDYVCGECETILMEGVQQDKCLGLVLLCNKCGSFNAALLRTNGPQ
jgi:hypothetical protein